MKKTITAVCLFLCASAPSFANTPSAESLDALFEVTRASALMESLSTSIDSHMRQSMEQALAGEKLTDAQRRAVDSMARKSAQIVRDEITWAKLKPVYVRIYQESLTQEDIDGLVAFYRSPAGDAMVRKMPQVVQKTMTEVQAMLGPMMEKLKVAQAEAIAEAKSLK